MAYTEEDVQEITAKVTADVTAAVVSYLKENFFLAPKNNKFYFPKTSDLVKYIIVQTCSYFEIEESDFLERKKTKVAEYDYSYSEIRFMVMKLCRVIPLRPVSFPTIAKKLNIKWHASIIYGVRTCDELLKDKSRKEFKYDYDQIEKLIRENLKIE